jgi:hypothetical protein
MTQPCSQGRRRFYEWFTFNFPFPHISVIAMNFLKPIALSMLGLADHGLAIQSMPSDPQTTRNIENMEKLAEKVKSLISRYSV